MYSNIEQLIRSADETNKSLHQIILDDEVALTEKTEAEIYDRLRKQWEIMKASINKALQKPQKMVGSLIEGQSSKQMRYAKDTSSSVEERKNFNAEKRQNLLGSEINVMMAKALSASEVNASMGRICAAPTGGACGILPAVIDTVSIKMGSSEADILEALLVAGGFGAVVTRNATVSGAEGGCQAECGTAAAMAAAAAVYLSGGTNQMCADAAAITLMNCMGLICDPVAGLVQLPCSFRNASQSVNALVSADMALAGQSSVIPVDEVIDAMYKVGKRLPTDFKETALGGVAVTKKGKEIARKIFE